MNDLISESCAEEGGQLAQRIKREEHLRSEPNYSDIRKVYGALIVFWIVVLCVAAWWYA